MNGTWLRRFGPVRDRAPLLVCLPHAGASASAFLALSRAFEGAAGPEVLAVQYPGRQDRRHEAPARGIEELAGRVADACAPLTGRPYAFFGHSMGAVVAYETARLLLGRGLPGPGRLFLSGRGAPGPVPSPHDRLDGDAEILAAVRKLGAAAGAGVLDDPELLAMVLPALRADYGALARYRSAPGGPLPVPLTVLVGDADPVVTVDEARAWRERTSAGFALEVFEGGHFYLDRQVDAVAKVVSAGLPG
ncbi:alpha/beta fold hydrolase [Streptomyces sp. NPDC004539]|uniref:thioesterase II family protein n=1 Tax=Streptomyces sp. NPDC004539 TaxID=3154280 RepID=UPI0033BF2E06